MLSLTRNTGSLAGLETGSVMINMMCTNESFNKLKQINNKILFLRSPIAVVGALIHKTCFVMLSGLIISKWSALNLKGRL